jgi:hypothetical protein
MPNSVYWQSVWVVLGAAIFISALFAGRSRTAAQIGRASSGLLFVAAGSFFNALNLATGGDYGTFAKDSYIPFVRDTWASLVAPHQDIFIPLLVAFEAAVGLLILSGGRRMQLGFVGAIGFHVALVTFGWFFYPWSVAMVLAFALLLRAERKHEAMPVPAPIYGDYRIAA